MQIGSQHRISRRLAIACVLLLAPLSACAQSSSASHWITTWASAQQVPEPQNALPPDALTNATLRQNVHLSVGGDHIRLRLSNAFGTQPLTISHVHVAVPASLSSSAILKDTDHEVRFNGDTIAIIPAGAELLSDPIEMKVSALSSLSVSMYFAQPPQPQTGHPGSRATSYYAPGDLTDATDLGADVKQVDHWFQLAAVEVEARDSSAFTIVTLGDSITDGHGATTNGNDRWPDRFAARLQESFGNRVGIANAGIGGNRLLLDGLGPNAVARFDRDVLVASGVRWVILLEGVNDLGTATREKEIAGEDHALLVKRILSAYGQMIEKAHAHGIRIAGATITPYTGSDYYHPAAASEADRQAINQWIRTAGHFDAVIDFDAIVRDPAAPEKLLPTYDSGDHLHPSVKGYAAMADGVDLRIFSGTPKQSRHSSTTRR